MSIEETSWEERYKRKFLNHTNEFVNPWKFTHPTPNHKDLEKLAGEIYTFLETELSRVREETRAEMLVKVRDLIKCERCKGQGAYLGAELGVSECYDCGGDGQCIPDLEGTKLDAVLESLGEETK